MSLRTKLLLCASLLLLVPLAGYRFVVQTERYLREHQSASALDAARTLAIALESRPELLPRPDAVPDAAPDLPLHVLAIAPEIDGYDADWGELAWSSGTATPRIRAARRDEQLFLLLATRAAAAPAGRDASRARLRLVTWDTPAFARAWLLDVGSPGLVSVREVPPAAGTVVPAHVDDRLRAAARIVDDEVRVELRVPLALLATRIRVEVLDAREPPQVAARLPASSGYRLRLPPPGLRALVGSLAPSSGRRVRVTDSAGRVLADAGGLGADSAGTGLAGLLERALDADEDRLLEWEPATHALHGEELAAALGGSRRVRLRRVHTEGPLVVSAAYPLRAGERVVGALVLEESTSPIQALGRRAVVDLFTVAAAAFTVASIALLLVSGRMVARLRGLRDQAASAIDSAGRVRHDFPPPSGSDEIADLGRSFRAAVSRLAGYQDYLEQLARRLSHELRTPLTIIRTSLDAVALSGPDGSRADPEPFLERARHGVDRLESLIRRMSEATRLEQSMTSSERAPTDLCALVRSAVQAHRAQWTAPRLGTEIPDAPVCVLASAELLLQALDKLLSNARDFARPESEVRVRVHPRGTRIALSVENSGPTLPRGANDALFESMVSHREHAVRDGADAGEAHLGLGLYVVRLVAEFHAGEAFAENLPGDDGVRVGIALPLLPAPRAPTR